MTTSTTSITATTPANRRKVHIDKYIKLISDELGYPVDWKITSDFRFIVHAVSNRSSEYTHYRTKAGDKVVSVKRLPLLVDGPIHYVEIERPDKTGVTQYYQVMVDWFM
jgi:hypothetical protein